MPIQGRTQQTSIRQHPTRQGNPTRDTALAQIARRHLFISTLETQHSGDCDFHEVAVWSVEKALREAYELGRAEASRDYQSGR